MIASLLENLKAKKPLVHVITNFVAANDCANLLLAAGASPIMADSPQEAKEITAQCQGLCLNMGTPSAAKFEAMLHSGQTANRWGIPVVLDPVGVGASRFRQDGARALLENIRFQVIRGNLGEIRTLAEGCSAGRGVDAGGEEEPADLAALAKRCSEKMQAVVVITGETDVVADEHTAYCIHNGNPMMGKVTGSGCMLSALLAAFLAADPEKPLDAALAAVIAMGLAGEKAAKRLCPGDGNASYRTYLIDAVYNLTSQELQEGACYEMR